MVDVPQLVRTLPWFILAFGSIRAWAHILASLHAADSLLPFEQRRVVPWRGPELVVIVVVYLTVQAAAVASVDRYLGDDDAPAVVSAVDGDDANDQPPADAEDELAEENSHPVILLLLRSSSWWVISVCILAALVVAPLIEEFVFRVLFQGWMERFAATARTESASDTEGRAEFDTPSTASHVGTDASAEPPSGPDPLTSTESKADRLATIQRPQKLPILISAATFSLIHFRTGATEPILPEHLLAVAAASLLTLLGAGLLLTRLVGATPRDLGLSRSHLVGDVRLGIAAFFAIAPVVYGVQILGVLTLPERVAADPIALFPFAIVLGYLYQRTHRVLPSVVAHFCLNAFSFGMVWLQFPPST